LIESTYKITNYSIADRTFALCTYTLIASYVMNKISLEEVVEIKDLGVYYDSLLLFDKHISEKVKKSLHDAGYY